MEKTSKGGEKIIALLSENSKLIAASLAAEIGSCCPGIVLCSWNIKFWEHWKNRARETLYSGCLLTLLVTKKRSTKVAIKLTPARVILTGDFFRSFGFRPGRRGN